MIDICCAYKKPCKIFEVFQKFSAWSNCTSHVSHKGVIK
jgi:hypothetical protein